MEDLVFSNREISPASFDDTKIIKQIISGMNRVYGESEEFDSFTKALKFTDNHSFWMHKITVTNQNNKVFMLYIYSAGDNIHGFFVDNDTGEVVAEIGDGSIVNCTARFEF